MVPLGALRTAAPVSDLDHDESRLGKRHIRATRRERFRDRLGLRAGINILDHRIALTRVEVKRLVQNAIQIGDAVVRFDLKRLRILVAALQEGAHIGRLQISEQCAASIAKRGMRRGVDRAAVIDKVAGIIVHRGIVIRRPGIHHLQVVTIQPDTIQVREVRVLAGFPPAGAEIEDAVFCIDTGDPLAGKLTGGYLGFQCPVGAVQIKMPPAVPLGPENNLAAVVHQVQGLRVDIGVQPLLNNGFDIAGHGVGDTHIQLMTVAAGAGEVNLIRRVAEPLINHLVLFALLGQSAIRGDIKGLVLEFICLDPDTGSRRDIKDKHLRLRLIRLAGHSVAVGFQRGPWLGQ